ncbi:MAG TPA: hypothetical protein VEX60_16595 [Pyrinomonadaceae bacterium]|nr:hypothetical protein [Pyrinomonadaceae bacterium]
MRDAAALEHENTETEGAGPGLRVPFSAPAGGLAHAARRRLTTLVITKLTLDLFFVAGLAVYSHAVAFNPFFTGTLDHADGRSVRGWVVDRARPDEAVEVHLYIDNRFVAAGVANEPRPDVKEKGFAEDERHGFVFNLEPELYGEHQARVYAVHTSRGGTRRTLQQIGKPLNFARK